MADKNYYKWKAYFKSRGLKDDLIIKYLKYINTLNKNRLPIIFELEHFGKLVGIKSETLNKMIYAPDKFYRTFTMKKRKHGEIREITVPYPSLKSVQSWINDNILSKQKVHYSVHGYVKKKSTVTNAKIHLDKKELLKVDLKEFFPSIKIKDVVKLFQSLGYTKRLSFQLASLCCHDGVLAQGASTSPALSNIILFKMDVRLTELSKSANLKYSRYADDIAISGDYITHKLQDTVFTIIKESGFEVNLDKTYLSKENSNKRILTGLSIKGSELKIPRKMKRAIIQEMFYINKYGLKSHMINKRIKNYNYFETIYGKLKYWKYIEPNSEKVDQLIDQLITSRIK
ncbi:reverse transcriptase family protein [Aliarcobacter butzleri]|uniref:reverse transcriptase family protein n=1 Tax=Aliarcobacter butzleri TaxID=28197 RepID=UPI00263CD21E|nr:reverse transcriptase family protein [Aliarcobacter butzleri]MDN5049677.1 reverse transcriptase family protein [Aliarcobacter butzleri]MDN5056520.1 reverse transcriptase family protein [Aliarcobacter butzleri]